MSFLVLAGRGVSHSGIAYCHQRDRTIGHVPWKSNRVRLAKLLLLVAVFHPVTFTGCGSGERTGSPSLPAGADLPIRDANPVTPSPGPAPVNLPLAAVAWSSVPDPAPECVGLPSFSGLEIHGRLSYPRLGCSAVLFGSEVVGKLTAYDLRNNRRIGGLPKMGPIVAPRALGPDGRLLAGNELVSGRQGIVTIWNMETGTVAHTISVSDRVRPKVLEFLDNNTLLAFVCAPDAWTASTWSVEDGSRLGEFHVPFERTAALATGSVSPGGRYLILLDRRWLHIYDLSDGQCTGRLALPESGEVPFGARGHLAFSSDGTRLGAILIGHEQCRVLCWDFGSGRITFDTQQPSARQLNTRFPGIASYRGPALQYLPGETAWLMHGNIVLNEVTGAVEGKLEPFVRNAPYIFPDGKMLAARRSQSSGKDVLELMDIRITAFDDPSPPPRDVVSERTAAPLAQATPPSAGSIRHRDGPDESRLPHDSDTEEPAVPLARQTSQPASNDRQWNAGPDPCKTAAEPGTVPAPAQPLPADFRSSAGTDDADERSWTARADPPPNVPSINDRGRTFSFPMAGSFEIFVPRYASKYAVVHEVDRDRHTLFDVDVGKPVGKPIDVGIKRGNTCVSSDGRLLAVRPAGDGTTMQVWSFETGEMLSEFDVGVTQSDAARLTTDGLLVVVDDGRPVTGIVWDVKTGRRIREFTLSESQSIRRNDDYGVAVSPGGRYAAILFHGMLRVWELATGGLVGSNDTQRVSNYNRFKCLSLRFTPEGDELVAICAGRNFRAQMSRWDFNTGQLVQYRRLGLESDGSRDPDAPEMNWLPGHSFFLYRGKTVVDHLSGEQVYELKVPCDEVIKLLDLHRLLVVRRPGGGTMRQLAAVTLPRDGIVAAVKAVRQAPGQQVPEHTPAKLSAARVIQPPQGAVSWSVEPDPSHMERQPVLDRISIAKGAPPKELYVSPQHGKAYLLRAQTAKPNEGVETKSGAALSATRRSLEVYDLTTGQRTNHLPLAKDSDLLSIGSDGDLALTRSAPEYATRLDVWSMGQQRHVVGWIPDPKLDKNQQSQLWGAVVDSGHVLTISNSCLTCWELPACRASYRINDFGNPVAMSPQRKFLVAFQSRRGLHIYETLTGQCRGALPLPESIKLNGASARAAAFHPNGRLLIALLNDRVVVWDLLEGRLSVDFAVMPQATARYAQWLDDRYVFFHSRASTVPQFLVDVQNRAVVRQYSVASPALYAAEVMDGSVWYCSAHRFATDYRCTLLAASLPLDEERTACEAMQVENQVVAHPGTRVGLSVRNGSSFTADLEGILRRAIEQSGLVVDPSAALRLELQLVEEETSELVEVMDLLNRNTRETISIKKVKLRRRLVNAAGKELWKSTDRTFVMSPNMFERGTKQEIENRLRGRLQKSLDDCLDGFRLPKYFFPSGTDLDIPLTRLSDG